MTLPDRLLSTSLDEFELGVLRSIEEDRPSGAAYARTAKALGIGLGTAGAWSATALATGAAGRHGALGHAAVLGALKFTGIGVAVGVTTASAVYGVARWAAPPRNEARTASAPSSSRAAPTDGDNRPSWTDRGTREPGPSRALPSTASWTPRPPVVAPAAPPPAPAEGSPAPHATGKFADLAEPATSALPAPTLGLSDEVAMLDRVRTALRGHDGRTALLELEGYDRSGARLLATEATLLRIEALLEVGQRARAQRLAADLLAQRPPARVADRLRTILGTGQQQR